ncbi:DUF72 domain-containing protein [Neptunomonas antarctica]|uniref:Uncharacterized conserved protein YecE, DUF72 family n=1 Tax=Neptunomonas antarctica TaxID=619304 RepID=A0A1N7MUT0_9GAMM|nr:DUF72 domain-containing protein [Neptunomonas antarctica]SIS89812.1 Uncharacterized conserved protein YecE, DUF72 family [Neptunomonas antarctica]
MHTEYPTHDQAYFIGLPQWHHPNWYPEHSGPNQALQQYTQHFSSVEGNSSFYGLPNESTIQQWKQQSSPSFRFCFKFPQTITHHLKLQHSDRLLTEFLNRITPLEHKLGILWLQLNASFGPQDLEILERFINRLPTDFSYAIEVRHSGFFNKDDLEKRFNQILMRRSVNRITFDTRALFSHPAGDPITQEALKAKPRMPVHVIATGQHPFVRIITPLNIGDGYAYLIPWINKTLEWIDEGRTPYLFFHTPDNKEAPAVASFFAAEIHKQRPNIPALTLWNQHSPQPELF